MMINIMKNTTLTKLNKLKSNKCIICCAAITVVVLICVAIANIYYRKGYNDHVYYADDSSPIVYITHSGDKYHKSRCTYIRKSDAVDISLNKAEKLGYSRCSDCRP